MKETQLNNRVQIDCNNIKPGDKIIQMIYYNIWGFGGYKIWDVKSISPKKKSILCYDSSGRTESFRDTGSVYEYTKKNIEIVKKYNNYNKMINICKGINFDELSIEQLEKIVEVVK